MRGDAHVRFSESAGVKSPAPLNQKTLLDSLRKRASDIETMQRSLDEDIARVAAELHMDKAEVREEIKGK